MGANQQAPLQLSGESVMKVSRPITGIKVSHANRKSISKSKNKSSEFSMNHVTQDQDYLDNAQMSE